MLANRKSGFYWKQVTHSASESLGNYTFYNSSLVIILYGNSKPVLKPCLITTSNKVSKIMKI